MTLVPSTAASAVYHDALSTARKFRTLCFLILLLALLGQLALFFTARYGDGVIPVLGTDARATVPQGLDRQAETEAEVDNGAVEETDAEQDVDVTSATVDTGQLAGWLYMALYATLWLGLIFALLLSLDLLFGTLVMLNGRTVGVERMAKAFLYSLILLLLLMPWQAILTHPGIRGGPFHLPGVLYTWPELNARALFADSDWLGWVRFVAWPVLALIFLFLVYGKSGRGIKQALGEDLPADESIEHRAVS